MIKNLREDKIKNIILTIDYELYLGKITGTVKECMIEPTMKLASYLKKNNSKMTVFWDVLHYYRLLQYENNFAELKEDRLLIEKQILELVESGHDIQLHLHPHWLDAHYEYGKWVFQYDRFRLNKLSNANNKDDINTITGCIFISKCLIEKLIQSVDPGYQITSFRAGGYLIEPFQEISDALIANNIKIDSSVCSGLYYKNGINSYDFRDYPHNQRYKFTLTPRIIVDEGCFMEIPIATIKLSFMRNVYYKILKKINYNSLENERKGLGIRYTQNIKLKTIITRKLSNIFGPRWCQFTLDSNFLEKFSYFYKKVPEYATMIIHPKLLNSHTLKIMDDYLAANKIHFISIKDYIS